MATEYIGLPGELIEKVKEAATLDFGERNARARGLTPEDVDAEISAARSERAR